MTRRYSLLLTVWLWLLHPLAVQAEGTPVYGGTLRLLVEPEPKALLLLADASTSSSALSAKVTEGLLGYDDRFQPLPQLAVSWAVSDDGLVYRFGLRANVRWHDGQPFSSADVSFSIEQARLRLSRAQITLANIERVETPDPLTVVIHLRQPVPYFIRVFAANETPIIPRHLYEGRDFSRNPHNVAPIGTGPFRFKQWVRGSHILYERNRDYWNPQLPYLDYLLVRFFADPAARIMAFEANEVDMEAHSTIPLYAVRKIQAVDHLVARRVSGSSAAGTRRVEFNLDHPILGQLPVRQAIAHAIDKHRLQRAVFSGFADIAISPIVPGQPYYQALDDPYPYDLARAEALLDQAGFKRRSANGERFRLTLDYLPEGSGEPRRLAEFVKASLRPLGITVQVRSADLASYMTRIYRDRDFEMVSNGLGNSFDPTVGTQRAYWSKSYVSGVPFTNASHYANAEVDRLLEAAAIEMDESRRQALFSRFQAIVATEIPVLNLMANWAFLVHQRHVRNLDSLGAQSGGSSLATVYLQPDDHRH